MGNAEGKLTGILSEALALHESGVSISEIIRRFPKHETELREVFRAATALKKEGGFHTPDPVLLKNVLARVPDGAPLEEMLLLKPENAHRRFSVADVLHNSLSMPWRVVVPALLVLVIGFFAFSSWMIPRDVMIGKQEEEIGAGVATEPASLGAPQELARMSVESPLPAGGAAIPVTGNVDDATAAIIADADAEQAALAAEETDVAYAAYDSQAIADFGQSYEDQF